MADEARVFVVYRRGDLTANVALVRKHIGERLIVDIF